MIENNCYQEGQAGGRYRMHGIIEMQDFYRRVQGLITNGVVHKSLIEAALKVGAVTNLEILNDNPKIAEVLLEEWKEESPIIFEELNKKIEAFEGRKMGVK